MTKKEGKLLRFAARQGDSGRRLDSFLTESASSDVPSRVVIRTKIESGSVFVNGITQTNPAKRLRYGDVVDFEVDEPEVAVLSPNHDLSIPVIFENEHVLAISKPAGVQMHPAGNDTTRTVSNWVMARYPEMASIGSDPLRPGIVHRLDRNTSGVVLLAKTPESFLELRNLFRKRKVKKAYSAIVVGHVPEAEAVISYPLTHRTGTLRRRAIKETKTDTVDAKEAITEYKLQRRFQGFDLLEVFPKTGRTHQIRVHLSAIGHPVAGDRLYGGRRMKRPEMPERQLLHAASISLSLFGTPLRIESPLPPDFSDFISSLDGMKKAGYPGKALNRMQG